MKRTAFFISDSTGITAETLGHSLLTQFPSYEFEQIAIPYVTTPEKAQEVVTRINEASRNNQARSLVFSTLAKPELRNIIADSDGLLLDFFDILIGPLEEELESKYAQTVGESHAIANLQTYENRVAAIEFATTTDDGVGINQYQNADIILIGVSRSGKTPTSLYLALKFGIFAANYPLTEEDLKHKQLPEILTPYLDKLFGLTITAQRLHEIRQQRRPNSNYASLQQCQQELQQVEQLFRSHDIPYLNSTSCSIEEIATRIMSRKNLNRHLF